MSLPKQLYTGDQVKQGEAQAAKNAGYSLYQLMEMAGESVFSVLEEEHPRAQNITVLCGGGNNGGDGFVVARLAKHVGLSVQLISTVDESRYVGDALQAKQAWLKSGGTILSQEALSGCLTTADVIVDGLLGTGLSGEVRDDTRAIIDSINQCEKPVIAIDIPSGLCSDTGTVLGGAICAQHTVTFIAIKQGLVTGQARDVVGKLHFSGLNVQSQFAELVCSNIDMLSLDEMLGEFPKRRATAHKGKHGRVLCIGGNQGYGGAIRMCAQAAARSGAGLVSCICHPVSSLPLMVACPEVMTIGWQDDLEQLNSKSAAQDVLAFGPGLGTDSWAHALFHHVQSLAIKKVVDADGLNLLAQSPNVDANRVITPHPGEAARLLNCSVAEIESNRYSAVKQLQDKFGGVVVLKGAGSLVCDGRRTYVCLAGNPGMATGGMGDVLTGIIAALIAQGVELSAAARLGVQLHSQAADLVAAEEGMIGLLASDVIGKVRQLLNFSA